MIRMEGIGKCYTERQGARPLWVLKDVSLRIRPGEYVALTGASGSGKSTLMHLLGCLDTPTEGRYFLDGMDVSHMDAQALCRVRREKIGFVFQGVQLLQKLNALDNVAFPLMLRGVGEQERKRIALEALDKVGLKNRATHRPCELSGGQQQRVAMARALCYDPRLLLCDEPTGALDEENRDEILALFDALHQSGRTIVLITHDLYAASRATRRYQVTTSGVLPLTPA